MKRLFSATVLLLGAACSSPDKPADQAAAPTASPDSLAATAAPAAPAAAPADTAQGRFRWDDEMCSNIGFYPAGRYTEAQLRDARVLVETAGYLNIDSPRNLAEMQPDTVNARLRRLTAAYGQQRAQLQGLRVVPGAYWQQLQRLRVQELEEDYQLQQTELRAFLDPQALTKAPGPAACRSYVQALTSADPEALFRAWRQLVDAQKQRNSVPDNLEREFQQQSASPERAAYARLALMRYGWWNCVNANKQHGDVAQKQQVWKAFEKLFTKVNREGCEDGE